jgi:hypothetical protein
VATAGQYTALVWVEDKKLGTFGRKMVVDLPAITEP